MKPLLVGEQNPYQADPRLAQRYALYPDPPRCAGWNLCHLVMGLDEDEYLRSFDRVNLCDGKWSMREARTKAENIKHTHRDDDCRIVLFGAKVCRAFEMSFYPFSFTKSFIWKFVILPHPSGLSRAWNEPGAYERARAVLRKAGVL